MGGGALLYLTGVGPLQRALQRLVALALPAPIRTPQAGQGAAAGQPPPAPQWTFFGELQAVIVGFFSSLIPGMACTCPCKTVVLLLLLCTVTYEAWYCGMCKHLLLFHQLFGILSHLAEVYWQCVRISAGCPYAVGGLLTRCAAFLQGGI